jgi:hypothetical protein
MKKLLVVLFVFAAAGVFAQQKFALVIGNGAYAHVTKLNNPVNDANDVAAALQGMGFTVDKVLNGTQEQMESAAIRLKNRLSAAKNSYGLLFYAGHGVQSGGENYLIPVDANIQSESFLRSRAVSVQAMLDELNEAGNELNVVVLDACRDNPFSWRRSGSRGLSVVGQQPADSIIVFATSAGSTAADGTGRNGLFTSNFLNNLKTPGLEVTEVFRRTMGDVARASNNEQRPAVYNQFYGTAYLGTRPTTTIQPTPTPVPAPTERIYRIGDTGPAGGIIFYDKGNNSGGWRYLEAAPSVTDRVDDTGSFPAHRAYADITDRAIGAGLANTRIYLEKLRMNNITGITAPWICNTLAYNGFNDWYLPSLDELLMMYTNVRNNRNAGFSPTKYWTSTCFPINSDRPGSAYFVNFSNGQVSHALMSETVRIRACRRF